MSYTPKAGDEVYSSAGELGLYVSLANGGGHIVQPMIEDGDDVNEPASHYVDGVALWPNVYRQPPRPMLDDAIAQQQQKLAALRREVAEAEAQKFLALSDQRAVMERLKQHKELQYVDDFLNATITHYVVEVDSRVRVMDSLAFSQERSFGYSERLLTLAARVDNNCKSLKWIVKTDGVYSGQREIYAFPGAEPAMEKARELVTLKMKKAAADVASGYGYGADNALADAMAIGMEPLPELVQALRDRGIREAQEQLKKATEQAQAANQRLAELSTT